MPHEIYQRGKIWHFRGTAAGERFRGTTGTTDKALAQRIAAEAEAREWKRHLDGPGAHVSFAQAATAYVDANRSTRFLVPLIKHFNDTPLREISTGTIRAAALKLYPKAKGATRNRQVIGPMLAIINHAAELNWCAPVKVKRFAVDPKVKTPATREWVKAFAAQAVDDNLPHLAALCLFMFGTAARSGEAVRLEWGDVDLHAKTAKLSGYKPTPWTRTAHLPPALVAALANIGGNRNPDELVFAYAAPDSVTQVWHNVLKRAGIERLTPHCCRHGFATTMLHAGFDPVTIAKRGGWKDAALVVRTYGHALEDTTVTDVLFDTNVTQTLNKQAATIRNKRNKST